MVNSTLENWRSSFLRNVGNYPATQILLPEQWNDKLWVFLGTGDVCTAVVLYLILCSLCQLERTHFAASAWM
jgi:hypothetical protein